MARIGSYLTDDNVTGDDKVLGTDSSGSTKNYELDSIADYFSKANVIAVGGQVIYEYKSDSVGMTHAEFTSNDGAGGDGILMSVIDDIVINKAVRNNLAVTELLKRIFDGRFRIYGVTNADDYYDYEVTRIEDHPEVTNAYKISVVPISGNANSTFSDEDYYAFSPATGDKTFTHTQGSASTTWVITHNLGKYPSVSIQDSAGSDLVGDIDYNSDRKLTITFSGAVSGTAHLN